MKEFGELIGKLIAVLFIRNLITKADKDFIVGDISEAEWLEADNE